MSKKEKMSKKEEDFQAGYLEAFVKWRIKDYFSLAYKEDHQETSSPFTLSDSEFNLSFYPNGETAADSVGWLGLYIFNLRGRKLCISYTIGIRKKDGSVYKAYSSDHQFVEYGYNGVQKLVKASELLKSKADVSEDDSLTLFLIARDTDLTCTDAAYKTSPKVLDTLSCNFQEILQSGCHNDAIIKVKDCSIPVHRSILAVRSPVFESMFDHDMLEKNNGIVNIEEYEPQDVKDFLLFLYGGRTDHVTSNNAPALYKISHKYDVKELRERCIKCMNEKISIESFCNIIVVASVYDELELLKAATDFFLKNAKVIVRAPEWSSFSAEHHNLSNKLIVKLADAI